MGLAGVKRKQRISVDPQNKTWKDGTNFITNILQSYRYG
jgi:hypothetical protein